MLLGSFHPRWQGVATSGNTLRRWLMAEILTLPAQQVPLWRTRPDDCLFYGADILGGHKYYLSSALARHRADLRARVGSVGARAPLRVGGYGDWRGCCCARRWRAIVLTCCPATCEWGVAAGAAEEVTRRSP